MGFQSGSKIDPRLGALDYSGYTNAAAIQGQAMANLGSQIGGAITQYKKKKEEKQLTEQAANMILSYAQKNPDAASELGVTDLETAKVAIKSLGGAAPTLQMLSQLQPVQAFEPRVKDVDGQQFVETSKGKFVPMPETKEKRQTVDITAEQVQDYINRGVKIKGEPLAGGGMRVTDTETLAPKSPLVSIDNKGKEELSDYEKDVYSSQISPIVQGLPVARDTINKANLGLQLLDKGVPTGTGEEAILFAKKAANFFGGDFDVSNQELFQSKIEPMMMDFVAQTKGAISDKEMEKFQGWSASLSKTVEGNRKILMAMKKAAENVKEVNKLLAKYPKASPMEQKEIIDDYLEKNPLVNYEAEAKSKVRSRTPEEEAEYQELLRLQQG